MGCTGKQDNHRSCCLCQTSKCLLCLDASLLSLAQRRGQSGERQKKTAGREETVSCSNEAAAHQGIGRRLLLLGLEEFWTWLDSSGLPAWRQPGFSRSLLDSFSRGHSLHLRLCPSPSVSLFVSQGFGTQMMDFQRVSCIVSHLSPMPRGAVRV